MRSWISEIKGSKIRALWKKRWPSLSAIALLSLWLVIELISTLIPDDSQTILALVQKGWRLGAQIPCAQQIAPGHYYQLLGQESFGEIYFSLERNVYFSLSVQRSLNPEENSQSLLCTKIQGPSNVEEIAFEPADQ